MSGIEQAWRKFIFLLRRRQMERDLAEEMQHHVSLKAQKNMDAGLDPQEAVYAAQRQLGNMARHREESRQNWGFPFLESVVQDVRYGLRGLRKAPSFTAIAALTLALGIGASTAIFSIVNAVVLRPLPYRDSSRMIHVWTVTPFFPEFQMGQSLPNSNDIKTLAHSLDGTTLYQSKHENLTGRDEPEQLSTAMVASNFFTFFGAHPLQGREFVAADQQMSGSDVALLSYGLWQRRFGGEARVIGSRIDLDEKPYTVIGVLPAGFSYPPKTDVWLPLVTNAKQQADRMSWRYLMLAKLRSGIALKNAQSELDGIAAGIARQYPDAASGIQFRAMTIQEATVGRGKGELLAVMGAVGFLLLIACANVSNLVLSRGFKRQREIAVRAALGASRARIMRQLLTESLLLAFAGGLAGCALGTLGVATFRALVPADFPRLDELRVESATILIACAITTLTGVLCALAPVFSASRANLNLAIQAKTIAASSRRLSLRGFLVIAEVASALILLTGSALMVQGLVRTLKVDTGLRLDHVLSATVSLPKTRYPSNDAFHLFARRLLDSLRAQPQFSGVALSNTTILKGGISVMALDKSVLAAIGMKDERIDLEVRSISPGFFETLAVRLVRGRFFNDRDGKDTTPVIIINDSVAKRFFPGQDPIGRTLKLGSEPSDQLQVVGQVPDTRDTTLSGKQELQVYFPLLQEQSDTPNFLNILVHTTSEPAVSIASLRNAVSSVDKDLPLTKVQTITEAIFESLAQPLFRTWLLSAIAVAGLALTLVGIYGVISYSVGQRTQEMGIRMALGAQRRNVLRLVLREGVVLALSGAICGVIGSFLLLRLLATQLYSIKPSDPPTLIGVALLMLFVALLASYLPARRATKVDPMIALRYE